MHLLTDTAILDCWYINF